MNMRITGVCLALLLAVTAIPALGAEGRIPVWQYPTSISAPGKYIVTRDIVGGGGIPIITIASSDVDLDINGFTLDQTAAGGAPVIEIIGDVDTLEIDVIIRNGILVNGTFSIERNNLAGNVYGDRVVIEDIQSRDATASANAATRSASLASMGSAPSSPGGMWIASITFLRLRFSPLPWGSSRMATALRSWASHAT